MTKPWAPYVVHQGDHLDKLAFRAGADADTVWGHEQNKDLAARRKNKNTLCPGDVIFLPRDPGPGLDLVMGASNRFTAAVPKLPIRVKLLSLKPEGRKFEVHGAGGETPIEGTVTSDGVVAFDVAVGVREVEVRIPELALALPLHIGDLDPIEEPSGVVQRLRNLGHLAESGPVSPEELGLGIAEFKRTVGLPDDGALDAETRRALEKKHRV